MQSATFRAKRHGRPIASPRSSSTTNPGTRLEPLEPRRMFAGAIADPDATIDQAHDMHALTTVRPLRVNDSLSADDRADCFKFSLAASRNVAIKLDLLSANLDLQLLDANGDVVASSLRAGATKEFISTRLAAGTFFVRVMGSGAASTYRLNIADSTEQTFFALAAQVSLSAANGDIFLRIPEADGEVSDTRYVNWIDVDSYAWGLTTPASTVGAPAGSPSFSPFTLTKPLDKSTPRLFAIAAQAKVQRSSVLVVLDGDLGIERLRITLGNVQLTEFRSGGSRGSTGEDSITLVYQTIRVRYTPVDDNGLPLAFIEAGWNLRTRKAL